MSYNGSEIIIYQTIDGQTKIDVIFENETVWLTQMQMAELFQTTKQNISLHINNIFKEGELNANSVVKEYLTTATDGKQYKTNYYNLDVIISVGYRVKSHRGTQFRIWASQILKEYLQKGFAMNDELLKSANGGNYFDELLARIRDIRSSEKLFYRKILEIYATSIDYDPQVKQTQEFFATIQNKMHFSAHGKTAAEVIYQRVDSDKDFMGLTSFTGSLPTRADAQFAKNYLSKEEIEILNRIVNLYLEYAELQALSKKPMYMKDWISKLDEFLNSTGRDILTHAGKISAEVAKLKAETEYSKFRERTKNELTQVEKHFLESINDTQKKLEGK
jgi:hypothetical protein